MRYGSRVRKRPKPVGHSSPNRPVSQIQKLQTGDLKNSHWRPHPIGQELTVGVAIQFATFNPVDCPVFGEQFDIITESLQPKPAAEDAGEIFHL